MDLSPSTSNEIVASLISDLTYHEAVSEDVNSCYFKTTSPKDY